MSYNIQEKLDEISQPIPVTGTVESAGRLFHTGNMNLDGHTGAVWVTTCGNGTNGVTSDFVYVEWRSVTV